LNDQQVAALPRRSKRYNLADPEQRGHYLRVSPDKATPISYAAVARGPSGKQVWATLGTTETLGIEQARNLAREAVKRIKAGEPTIEPDKPTVKAVADQWLDRHVRKNGFRTRYEMERIVSTYIVPHLGGRDITGVRRNDIAELLDRVEDNSGAPTADAVLKIFRGIAKWWLKRDENYSPPFVAGMTRTPKEQRARSRVLTDDEIRAVWKTAAANGVYGAAVQLLLLTAQRRDKIATMQWGDIHGDAWTIRTEAKEKGNPGKLRLPKGALEILSGLPRFAGNPYVFAGRKGAFALLDNGRYKREFDAKCGVTGWRLHDLRRTARSLMSRTGVPSEHAERVLGHAIGGVEGIYNRHSYEAEKAMALEKLAALIERIVNLPAENVVALGKVSA
jgi:integrase